MEALDRAACLLLRVMDNSELIEFELEDLRKYHGSTSICGLTVSYVIMEAAFDALAGPQPLERAGLHITSAFPGPGGRDGFEVVTRTSSRGDGSCLYAAGSD
ncbi:MAG: hypothetical protein ACR2PG_14935, partial [Hyphomicrobiaceae bacterium]